jgi:hypothetical protein
MSAAITWVIEWMNTTPTTATPPETVITAGWRCNGVETAGTPSVDYTSTVYGSCSFPMSEGTFTPYSQLTQEQVLSWCYANGVDKDANEASVQASIDSQITPTVIQPPLPWVASAA